MQYEISKEVRTLAIELENKRREKMNEEKTMPSNSSTKAQTSSQPERGTEYREELFYREGFKKQYGRRYY